MECRGFAVDAEWVTAMVVGIRYRRWPTGVRNMRAVLKKASWGTRRIFRGIRCKKQASTVRKGYSVPETPSYGTELCVGNSLYDVWKEATGCSLQGHN